MNFFDILKCDSTYNWEKFANYSECPQISPYVAADSQLIILSLHVAVPTLNSNLGHFCKFSTWSIVDVQKWLKYDCDLFEAEVQQQHFLATKCRSWKLCCVLAWEWPDHSQFASGSPVKALDSLSQQQARYWKRPLGFGSLHSSSFISLDKVEIS